MKYYGFGHRPSVRIFDQLKLDTLFCFQRAVVCPKKTWIR